MAQITADKREENRTRLLRAAADQFAQYGLARANINEISLTAGLAKGTVYNYFHSKRELFLAVVEEAFKLTERIPEPPADASLRFQLESLLAADVAWMAANEPFARVVVREMLNPDPELHPQILATTAPFIDRAVDILRVGARRGELRDDIPIERLALVFVGFGELAFVQHWGSGGDWPKLEEIPALVTDLFLRGAGS